MVERINGLPERYKGSFPYRDRPRNPYYYGVTEILYCLRKSFLQRVVPAPTAIDFETRVRFARGHAMEEAFFGEKHNPEYFVGDDKLDGIEGHSDHVVRDEDGKIKEIVEFKSVRRLWYKAPNGKAYYSIGMAKKAVDKEDWGKIEHRYNDSHMDQLKTYMYMTGAPKGVLIYYELTTDRNYTWEITSDEIDDDFKKRIDDRLSMMQKCMDEKTVPEKMFTYDWECNLCSFNKNGICQLCDVEKFDLFRFIRDLEIFNGKPFDDVLSDYLKKYDIKPGNVGTS